MYIGGTFLDTVYNINFGGLYSRLRTIYRRYNR